ncbi:hypothetical protein M153_2172000960 [Pseudoloma neurophilia]|uniref:Uncharacterized protein n=1 Tax=Pseudoloma neurophilia TaxID=146866 RepID=A0A0R0M287_9MICR|nr:hypothetical protein M153_2172000960 [Pseudoloma neurophilia]
MKEKYYIASTAIRVDQEDPDSQVTVKKCVEEAGYLCFEAKLSDGGSELTLQEGKK